MKGGEFMRVLTLTMALLLVACLSAGHAYTINGMLDDWGVMPHVQWNPAGTGVFWVEEDNWGSAHPDFPSGGERYDAEAMYCDPVGDMVYMALVTSFPSWGINGSTPGDFGIDLDLDGIYEYGLKTTGTLAGCLFADPVWTTTDGFPLSSPASIVSGIFVDRKPLVYQQTGFSDNGHPTWIIEGMFDRASVGGRTESMNLHWTMSCGNDVLDLSTNPVPEPGTLLLMAPGLAALWGFSRKRKRSS
jgi:hypothetical protein